jgi:hypothetical protein
MMQFIEMKKSEGTAPRPPVNHPPPTEATKNAPEVTLTPRSKKSKLSSNSDAADADHVDASISQQKDKKAENSTVTVVPSPSPTTTRADLIALSMRGRDVGREGVWDDGDDEDEEKKKTSSRIVSEETLQMISKTEKQLRRREQKEQQKKKLSEWDQLLDSGRQKKIKTGRPNSLETYLQQDNGGVNQFQEYQNYVQDKRAHGEYEDYRTTPMEKMKKITTAASHHQDVYEDDETDDERGDENDEIQEQRRAQQKVFRNQNYSKKMNGKKFPDRKFPNKNHHRSSGTGNEKQHRHPSPGKKGSFKPHQRSGK